MVRSIATAKINFYNNKLCLVKNEGSTTSHYRVTAKGYDERVAGAFVRIARDYKIVLP